MSRDRPEPGREYPDPREAEHVAAMLDMMRAFLDKAYGPGRKLRHFHPKMHGCVRARLVVPEGLPDRLRAGLFARPATYDCWVRFSNAPPRVQSDARRSGRGMAVKVLETGIEPLVADPIGAPTQDFLLTTSPVLSPGHPANYRRAIRALTRGFPWNALYALHPNNWRRVALTLKFMGKHADLLDLRWFSGAPFRWGEGGPAVKFGARPAASSGAAFPDDPADDLLRRRLVERLAAGPVDLEFLVQFQADPVAHPIEDTSRAWKAPWQVAGRLHFPAQDDFDTPERDAFGEDLVFDPWHALPAHRPLGGINRIRKEVYAVMSAYRKGGPTPPA